MRFAVVIVPALGILVGFLYGSNHPDRPISPTEPLELPGRALFIEVDPPPHDRLTDYLVFVAPTTAAISRASAALSTAGRRTILVFLPTEGEHRILVTQWSGKSLVDHTFHVGAESTRIRVLVPTSSSPPAEAGIAVYAVDPDGLPVRLDRVTGWIDHEGRTSRAYMSVGTAQSDGSMLVPIGAQVNRVLTGVSPGRLRLFVECSGLGARVVEVPKPENPNAPRSSAAIASVVVAFGVPSLPRILVTGEDGHAVPGELAGRLRIVARTVVQPAAPQWEAAISLAGRAELPPLAPGGYELRVLLDLVPPLDGVIELVRQERDLVSFDPELSIELPPLYQVALVGATLTQPTEVTLRRGDTTVCRWVLRPDERLDLHGLPPDTYELRWADSRRTFRVPDESEVAL